MHDTPREVLVKNLDEQQESKARFASLRRFAANARQHLGAIIGVTALVVVVAAASFFAGVHFAPVHTHASVPAVTDWPPSESTMPTRICDEPAPPVETTPPTDLEPKSTPPTEPCIPPRPDIIVLLSPAKAKALPTDTGVCATANGYGAMYTCGPRPYKDVQAFATKVLTAEQLAFVNDHVLSSNNALWAFDVKDTAVLKGQSTAPGATYDESNETITVYVW
jgi:hypothetical protein